MANSFSSGEMARVCRRTEESAAMNRSKADQQAEASRRKPCQVPDAAPTSMESKVSSSIPHLCL